MKTAESRNIWDSPWLLPKMHSTTSHIYDKNVEQKETIAHIWISTLQKWVPFDFLTGHFRIYTRCICDPQSQSQTESLLLLCFGCSSPRNPWAQLSSARLGFCKKRLYLCFGWQPTASSLPQRLRGDAADRVTLAAMVIVWCLQLPWALKQLKQCFSFFFLSKFSLLPSHKFEVFIISGLILWTWDN